MQPEILFPISLKLKGKKCLILGGGPVALAKLAPLLETGAHVRVVTQQPLPEIRQLADTGKIDLHNTVLKPEYCTDIILAIDSCAEKENSKLIKMLSEKYSFLLNTVDMPEVCDFFTPATVRRGPVQIAISTSGAAPALARNIRQQLDRLLPVNLGQIVKEAGQFRAKVKELSHEKQKAFWNTLFSPPTMKRIARRKRKSITPALEQLFEEIDTNTQPEGSVTLVGAGAGSEDMITIKGLRAIEQADVILYDALLASSLLNHARRDARLIAVGKRCGKHSTSQAFINRTLANLAKQGKQVVRLKCGDPFIFGRGGEELLYLLEQGIRAEIVPGVTAASVAAAEAGLPLTHRGMARRVTLMTASTNTDLPEDQPEWKALLSGGTVALYMARKPLMKLATMMQADGISPAMPVVIAANAGRDTQEIIHTTIADLQGNPPFLSGGAPTLAIIGETGSLAAQQQFATTENKIMQEKPYITASPAS